MKVGFTGTKQGMTREQMVALYEIFEKITVDEFHHGDCVGADAQAHNIVYVNFGTRGIVIHPPTNPKYRASCDFGCGKIMPEKDYLDRNHDIVDESDILIAAPCSRYEVTRSGTWATVRYARKQNKPIIIIWPEGDYVKENC